MPGKKGAEEVRRKLKKRLEAYPDIVDVSGGLRADIATGKLLFILIEASDRLNKWTKVLIGVTLILACLTTAHIVVLFVQ